jgi:hypothetical protein
MGSYACAHMHHIMLNIVYTRTHLSTTWFESTHISTTWFESTWSDAEGDKADQPRCQTIRGSIQGGGLQDQEVSFEDSSRITDQVSGDGSQRTGETMQFSIGIVLAAPCTYRICKAHSNE